MTAALATLNRAAQVALEDCEQRIQRGLRTFIEVGAALAAIRDNKLYRGTHETFEAYCRERWGFSDSRARQLVMAAETVTNVTAEGLPAPVNEGQARALAAVPQPERAEVWREVVESGAKPTAAAIRKAAEARTETPGPAAVPPSVVAGPGSTSPEPGPEPETCLGTDMDCGRPLPCPNHPRTPEERIAAVAAVAPEFVKPVPVSALAVTPEQRQQIAEDGERTRAISNAHRKADRLIAEVSAAIGEIEAGIAYGEPGLITPEMVAGLRAEADRLERYMKEQG